VYVVYVFIASALAGVAISLLLAAGGSPGGATLVRIFNGHVDR
jgi:uncharacterized membrane-anchored protein YitT (DUF2179 family)